MAEVYARQGKLTEARQILQSLLARQPDSADLQQRLECLEQQLEHVGTNSEPVPAAQKKEGDAALSQATRAPRPKDTGLTADSLRLRLAQDAIQCDWAVTVEGRNRARLELRRQGSPDSQGSPEGQGSPENGKLMLRVVGYPSELSEEAIDIQLAGQSSGSVENSVPRGALRVAAVIGLADNDGRFVAIAHSESLPLRGC